MPTGGIFKFSDILKIKNMFPNFQNGCIVDTSVGGGNKWGHFWQRGGPMGTTHKSVVL